MKETNINSQKETKVNPAPVLGPGDESDGKPRRSTRFASADETGETEGAPKCGRSADRNVGDTADKDVCGTEAPQEFLTKHELAQRLKRKVRTVERWQRRGIIPYVKCGHSVMFDWPDVVAHLQKNYRVCSQRSFGEPVRLPVYQMRDETKIKTKCRGLTGLRSEATARQASAGTKGRESKI